MRPGFAAVGAAVDAIARRDVVARRALARAHPDDLLIVRIDRDRADRTDRLRIEDRREGLPGVGAAPNAAARSPDVVQRRVRIRARDRAQASARDGRTEAAKTHLVEKTRRGRGLG